MAKKKIKAEENQVVAMPAPGKPQELSLANIQESKTNPRKTFKDIEDLAENLKKVGLLQPVTVRPVKGEKYELVCGARRFRAAKLAGLKEISTIVRELSDDQVMEIQLIENNQRKDINPQEESDGFAQMLKRGFTADQVAAKLGRDIRYVRMRLQLQHLIDVFRNLVLADRLPLSHAFEIARLTADDQKEIAKSYNWKDSAKAKHWCCPRLSSLQDHISQDFLLDLKAAAFDKTDGSLVPTAPACTTCPRRSGADASLFADIASKDTCFDRQCFNAKQLAHVGRKRKELKAAGTFVEVCSGYFYGKPIIAWMCSTLVRVMIIL